MAETLGSLCDKLTIVKLKQWHSEDQERLASLKKQEQQLVSEIDEYVGDATQGRMDFDKLIFPANKVYKHKDVDADQIKSSGSIGEVFSQLANTNCALWHEQEKVYEFSKVPFDQKDYVVEQLAVLNLRRTNCIDEIDCQFARLVKTNTK